MPKGRITHSQKHERFLLGNIFDIALPFDFRFCLCCRSFNEGIREFQQVLACHFDFEARTFGSLNECQKICHFSLTLYSTPRRSYDKKNAATRTGDSVKFCIIYLIGKFYNFQPILSHIDFWVASTRSTDKAQAGRSLFIQPIT